MSSKFHFETLALHAGQVPDSDQHSRGVPVYRTSAYTFTNTEHAANLFALKELGNIYTRIMNPTQAVLEERMAALEGGAAALALASGTSAVFYSIINVASAGEEIVSSSNLYGGTFTMFHDILPQFGITVRFVDPEDLDGLEKAINEKTRAVYFETIGNPGLVVADIEKIAAPGPRKLPSSDCGFHFYNTVSASTHRIRCGYRCPLPDQVAGRPWCGNRRCGNRLRPL